MVTDNMAPPGGGEGGQGGTISPRQVFNDAAPSPHRFPLQVLLGTEPANERIRTAAIRHMHDLTRDDIYFDDAEFAAFAATVAQLRITDGHELSGQPVRLLPWQTWVLGSILCWKKTATGGRRYKTAFLECGRGAGKTTLAATLMLHLATRIEGADLVTMANTVVQARQAYNAIQTFARDAWGDHREDETADSALFECTEREIRCRTTKAKIRSIASKSNSLDGLKAIAYLLDETSEATSFWMRKITSALPKLRDAFMLSVTTPGGMDVPGGRESPYYQLRRLATDALEEENWDKLNTFAALFGIDDDDDMRDPETWRKAQPSLDHVIPRDAYESILAEYESQGRLGDFERFQCCRFSTSDASWIATDLWRELVDPKAASMPRDKATAIYAAVDFSKSFDITSLCYGFWEGTSLHLRWHHWVISQPNANVRRDYQKHLDTWRQRSNVTVCEHSVQYELIREYLWGLKRKGNLKLVGFDALGGMKLNVDDWGSAEEKYNPATDLPMHSIPQTVVALGPATYLFESMIRDGSIVLPDDPVTEYALANVKLETNVNGDRRPSKMRSGGIIDPVVAMIMLGSVLIKENAAKPGAYSTGGDIAI